MTTPWSKRWMRWKSPRPRATQTSLPRSTARCSAWTRPNTVYASIDCGAEIAFERLMADPTVLRCTSCQQRYEHQHLTPGGARL